jgi:hypothetical protein
MKQKDAIVKKLDNLDTNILLYLEQVLQDAMADKLNRKQAQQKYSIIFRKDWDTLINPVAIHPTGGYDRNGEEIQFVRDMDDYFSLYLNSLTDETRYHQHPHHSLRTMLENAVQLNKTQLKALSKEVKEGQMK